MNALRKTVLLGGIVLFGAWMTVDFGRITADEDGLIRFVLGLLFCILILLRVKVPGARTSTPGRMVSLVGVVGAGLALIGIVFDVHQFEWLGLVLVLYGCLRWSLPERFSPDVARALFILYWVHPLPGQVFGPMQLAMQRLTVQGAEWGLHAANVPAWGDGAVLRAGYRAFGVPESCTGMRTAVTVLMSALGVGLLFRFKWHRLVILAVVGLSQVLLLNIVRVTAMVYWAPRMSPAWSETFLHDTLGIFLLVAIFLIQLEASWWKVAGDARERRLAAIARGEADSPDRATMLPRFWKTLFRQWLPTLAVTALVLGLLFMAYKKRPSHRIEMIRRVAEALMENDLESADRAIGAVLEVHPNDRHMLSRRARVLVMSGRYEEGLALFNSLEGRLNTVETILKSWTLMALDRPEEALSIVETLPEGDKKLPGVAIIRAEYAARRDDPEAVARNVVLASPRRALVHRIRALFPYLASREQWQAIRDADVAQPYGEFSHALIAVHACLRVGDMAGAARALDQALKTWPQEPRFLKALFSVAEARPGGRWEDRLEVNLLANLATLDADRLATYLRGAFALVRPDLAWLLYAQLRELDAKDPALALAVARHADEWFTFRKRTLSIPAEEADEKVDLRGLYAATCAVSPMSTLWSRVPLGEELTWGELSDIREKYLQQCLDELAARDKAGLLTRRLELTYPSALTLSGRYTEAHERLDATLVRHPELAREIHLEHARIYHEETRWQEGYEALRKHLADAEQPRLDAYLIMVDCTMNMNLGICSAAILGRAAEQFPGSPHVRRAQAAVWQSYGFAEQALFTIGGRPTAENAVETVQFLRSTWRIRAAEDLSRKFGVPLAPLEMGDHQPLMLPAAELTVARRWPPALTADELREAADSIDAHAESLHSPFTRALGRQIAEWYRGGGRADIDALAWESCARDDRERGAALQRLAVLLARQGHFDSARRATERGLVHLPRSAVLWRMLVGLTEGETAVVARAREVCPDDPDIWLASLVVRVREKGAGEWASQEVAQGIESGGYAVGTFVRAGHLFLRGGMTNAAAQVSEYVEDRAQGLVPAYSLGVLVGIATRDTPRMLRAALKGVEHALDPSVFFRVVVDAKTHANVTDVDLISALEYLQDRYPDAPEWSERLGFTYFRERDIERSLSVFRQAMNRGMDRMRPESLVLAAEAARVKGEDRQAIAILERAFEMHPGSVSILNNLVYILAQHNGTLPRARELLPRLLDAAPDSFAVMDTAAMVHLSLGETGQAKLYMDKALALLDDGDYSALETMLNSARVLYAAGEYRETLRVIERIRRNTARPDRIEWAARELMDRAKEKLEK